MNGSGENSLEPSDTGSDAAAEFTAMQVISLSLL